MDSSIILISKWALPPNSSQRRSALASTILILLAHFDSEIELADKDNGIHLSCAAAAIKAASNLPLSPFIIREIRGETSRFFSFWEKIRLNLFTPTNIINDKKRRALVALLDIFKSRFSIADFEAKDHLIMATVHRFELSNLEFNLEIHQSEMTHLVNLARILVSVGIESVNDFETTDIDDLIKIEDINNNLPVLGLVKKVHRNLIRSRSRNEIPTIVEISSSTLDCPLHLIDAAKIGELFKNPPTPKDDIIDLYKDDVVKNKRLKLGPSTQLEILKDKFQSDLRSKLESNSKFTLITSMPQNTRSVTSSILRVYGNFVSAVGFRHFPVVERAIFLWTTTFTNSDTANAYVYGVRRACIFLNIEANAWMSDRVKQVIKSRQNILPFMEKHPITLPELRLFCSTLSRKADDIIPANKKFSTSLRVAQLQLLACLSFVCLLRVGDEALNNGGIKVWRSNAPPDPKSTEHLLYLTNNELFLQLPHRKNNQKIVKGYVIRRPCSCSHINNGHRRDNIAGHCDNNLCPVHYIWKAAVAISIDLDSPSIFESINYSMFNKVIKRTCILADIGSNAACSTGIFRKGANMALVEVGASLATRQIAGDWRSQAILSYASQQIIEGAASAASLRMHSKVKTHIRPPEDVRREFSAVLDIADNSDIDDEPESDDEFLHPSAEDIQNAANQNSFIRNDLPIRKRIYKPPLQ